MARKTGDWRTVSPIYHGTAEAAREDADDFVRRHPDRRVRVKGWALLGYVAQTFVERTPRADR